ncbi:peptide deformylase [Rhodoligotrophos defluvii]|uniref:peptide deformylase n=1 Tax=Rhodoligotrophos defluvii TaxID=2561934 RepID=UPI0010CA045B|nr:peptide deformylase [Rhodoligotrophos defluvii]
MSIHTIIQLPDSRLREVSKPVVAVTDEIQTLVDDMFETMYAAPGVGLAAIQIGMPLRIFVADVAKGEEPPQPLTFINPEITWSSEALTEYEEGCLSIPEYQDLVQRPAEVKIRFLDRHGVQQEMHCSGLLATCVQHELDHLNGVLFIDHLSRLKRERLLKRFAKARRLKEVG